MTPHSRRRIRRYTTIMALGLMTVCMKLARIIRPVRFWSRGTR